MQGMGKIPLWTQRYGRITDEACEAVQTLVSPNPRRPFHHFFLQKRFLIKVKTQYRTRSILLNKKMYIIKLILLRLFFSFYKYISFHSTFLSLYFLSYQLFLFFYFLSNFLLLCFLSYSFINQI